MNICFLGLENLPVLAPQYRRHSIGGAQVQQTLLARALARAGHRVSMVVGDYGQPEGSSWHGIRTFRAYAADAGVPVLRFVHPRWTGIWSALGRADADLYYTSCAGMQVGLLAVFCRRHGKRFVFRVASDTDCDPARLLVRFARDRWLYNYGLRRADAILAQSATQADLLARNYGLPSARAGSLVGKPEPDAVERDIDVLWVNNVRRLKRPDSLLSLARSLPFVRVHMVGGPLPGEETLYRDIERRAALLPNVVFHGPLSYAETNRCYQRAKLLVGTSDVEGFPNTYLQSWVAGVPVVALFDPDGVIAREGLGIAVDSFAALPSAVESLLADGPAWSEASERCRAFMARGYGEAQSLAPYLQVFESLVGDGVGEATRLAANGG